MIPFAEKTSMPVCGASILSVDMDIDTDVLLPNMLKGLQVPAYKKPTYGIQGLSVERPTSLGETADLGGLRGRMVNFVEASKKVDPSVAKRQLALAIDIFTTPLSKAAVKDLKHDIEEALADKAPVSFKYVPVLFTFDKYNGDNLYFFGKEKEWDKFLEVLPEMHEMITGLHVYGAPYKGMGRLLAGEVINMFARDPNVSDNIIVAAPIEFCEPVEDKAVVTVKGSFAAKTGVVEYLLEKDLYASSLTVQTEDTEYPLEIKFKDDLIMDSVKLLTKEKVFHEIDTIEEALKMVHGLQAFASHMQPLTEQSSAGNKAMGEVMDTIGVAAELPDEYYA